MARETNDVSMPFLIYVTSSFHDQKDEIFDLCFCFVGARVRRTGNGTPLQYYRYFDC